MKNIDEEINKLIEIKCKILAIKKEIGHLKNPNSDYMFNVIPMSICKYNEFISNNLVRDDTIYYIIEPEVGQYIEGYIE